MVVLRHDQRFLLLKRAKPPYQGHYLPVGGKVDPFEDPYSAAVRELFEETGFQVAQLRYAGSLIETSPTAYNWQSNIYVADIEPVDPPACPEGILEWVTFQQIPFIPTPPTDWHIYQYLMREQPFAFNAVYDEAMTLLRMVEEIEGKVVVE